MALCGKCQAEYNKWATLQGELSAAAEQVNSCSSLISSNKPSFEAVIITGESLDKGEIDSIIGSLSDAASELSAQIAICASIMGEIIEGCGPDHFPSTTSGTSGDSGDSGSSA